MNLSNGRKNYLCNNERAENEEILMKKIILIDFEMKLNTI